MHFVPESAVGTRDRRKAETAEQLCNAARQFTADRGLHGFTVEDVCERAGVSRRTFFNYFATKEDAVIGIPSWVDDSVLDDQFVEAAAAGKNGSGLSSTLMDDFVALLSARWELIGLTPDAAHELSLALEREPRLVTHMLDVSRRREREDIELVERRERLLPGDLRAVAAVSIIGTLSRAAAEEFLAAGGPDTFPVILARRLGAARELFH